MGGRLKRERAEAGPARRGGTVGALRLLRCRRGAHAMEFALVANSLFILLFGSAEMMWQGLTGLAVENAILKASRAGSLGCLQPDGSRAGQAGRQQVFDAAFAAGSGILKSASLTVEPRAYNTVSAALADRNRQGGTSGTGSSDQVVVYDVTYVQPALFAGKLLEQGSYRFRGTITIKNEPFVNGGAGAQACS